MKIAMIGSAIHQAPFRKGIIHAPLKLSYFLAENLSKLNNDVTFFGHVDPEYTKDSKLKVDNLGYSSTILDSVHGFRTDFFVAYEQGFIMNAIKKCQTENYDLIYYYVPYRIGPLAGLSSVPIVATHHDSTHMKEYNLMYKSFFSVNLYVIPISNYLKNQLKYNNYLKTIYNGVDASLIPVNEPEDYYVWVGRIVESKGLHIALDLVERYGFKLKIAGPLGPFADFPDSADYSNKMKSRMNSLPQVEYLGVLDQLNTYNLISRARALIFPSDGTESCPLVPIESAVAGVPVITSTSGPMPEIIDANITGLLCTDIEEYGRAIKDVKNINRNKCREHAISRFSFEKIAEEYESEFKKVINH